MPLTLLDNVPCSEMRGGTLHQGPRTAGNKGMLSYRADRGIPGYSGYAPGWATVPVCVRGTNTHTGRLPAGSLDASAALERAAAAATTPRETVSECAPRRARRPVRTRACARARGRRSASARLTPRLGHHHPRRTCAPRYRGSFKADPADYCPPSKTGGGHWFEERQRAVAGRSAAAFLGTTTYAAELRAPQAVQQGQQEQLLARSSGPQPTRATRALSATTAATSTGLLGYRTSYGAATRALEEAAATAAAGTVPARPHSCGSSAGGSLAGTERLRQAGRPEAVAPAFAPRFADAHSTYARDFAPATGGGSLEASTRELAAGTTRVACQPPGFTGFVPQAATNARAVAHGCGAAPRSDAKQAMLPSALQQFGRQLVAGCTIHKPRGGAAATAVLPAHGPTAATASGFASTQVVQQSASQRADHTHAIDSRRGTMSFFTGGSCSISDNGLADAQRYWVGRRPMGGRMRHA